MISSPNVEVPKMLVTLRERPSPSLRVRVFQGHRERKIPLIVPPRGDITQNMSNLVISKSGTMFPIYHKGALVSVCDTFVDAVKLASAIQRGLTTYEIRSMVRVGSLAAEDFAKWQFESEVRFMIPMLSPDFLTCLPEGEL